MPKYYGLDSENKAFRKSNDELMTEGPRHHRATPELTAIHRQQVRLSDLLYRHVHELDHLLQNTDFVHAVLDRYLKDLQVHLGDPGDGPDRHEPDRPLIDDGNYGDL